VIYDAYLAPWQSTTATPRLKLAVVNCVAPNKTR
jgi:hypothetical protein